MPTVLSRKPGSSGGGGGGSTSPGGSNTQAQYNNAGSFGGSSALTLNATQLAFFGSAAAGQPAAPTTINEVIDALQTLGLVDT